MGKNISALIAGLIFGIGLTVSQMVNPEKVRSFLDIFGNWDPSLAFVMAAALLVTAIGYRLVWLRERPVFEARFQVPGNRKVDMRLGVGAVLFGAGWGLVGLCPGPALAAIAIGGVPALIFLAAMIAGIVVFDVSHLGGRKKLWGA